MLTGKEISESTPLKPQTSKFGEFLQSFSELRKSKTDLFYLFGVGLAKNLGLMLLNASITTYLSSIQHFSDVTIGYIIASFGGCVFTYSIILGSFIDTYGVRTLLITGNIFALFGFILIILIKNPYIQVFCMLTFISGGNSIILPSIKLGIKHYANKKARSLGYSMLFVLIYTGVAISGIIVDIGLTIGGKNENTFQILFMIGACLLLLSTFLSFFITPIKNNGDSSSS